MIKLKINVWRFGKHFVVDFVFILNSNLVGEINPILRRISIQREISRDRLFTLVLFSNVFTDLNLITAIQKKVSGKCRAIDFFDLIDDRVEIRLYQK